LGIVTAQIEVLRDEEKVRRLGAGYKRKTGRAVSVEALSHAEIRYPIGLLHCEFRIRPSE
jgi:hypothetical protein